MHNTARTTALLVLGASVVSAQASGVDQTPQSFSRTITKTVAAEYLLFLPRGYEPEGTKKWPLLLFLHGTGERGRDLDKVKVHGPPKIVRSRPDFPFILVSPQCPAGEHWSNDVLLALLDEVIARHRVDRNRIYLTGFSMSGFGTWSLAVRHPERFAAIAPICGGGEVIDVILAARPRAASLRTLGVWAFHGAKDRVVKVEESKRMVEAMRQIGAKDVELTIYAEGQHDCWTETYDNPKLFEWFLAHERKGE